MSQNKQQIANNNNLINKCIEQAQNSLVSEYEGGYVITPNTEQQTLPTKNRALIDDIIIEAAPGSTDYIGINSVYINEDGDLIICYSTGEEDNVGHVVGADGKDGLNGEPGKDGKDGSNGNDGVGIVNIEIDENGNLQIFYSNDTFQNVGRVVGRDGTNGKDGQDGINGTDGKDGKDGSNGIDGLTPTINDKGNWQIGNVDTGVKAAGIDGKDGADGYTPIKGIDYFDGINGKDGHTPTKGVDYFDGRPGADGFSPLVDINDINGGHRISITDKNGTKTFDVTNGVDGRPGQDGEPGEKGADGYTPQKGTDYMTSEDISNIVSKVLEEITVPKIDQVFDPSSQNAQSGVAIAIKLQNYATEDYINNQIGDINSALQSLINYAQSTTGGNDE